MRNTAWWKRAVGFLGWMPGWKGALILVLLLVCVGFVGAALFGG